MQRHEFPREGVIHDIWVPAPPHLSATDVMPLALRAFSLYPANEHKLAHARTSFSLRAFIFIILVHFQTFQ
ncbi:uncharacterized protein CC84DRAFT_1167043 [Paraphaeosphaeria sporulosa]|uniref:Uncharacterized protein n=1 Tax=Paraphaeosphaeria sporulosa TaxID=1460663 RepID=A0A177C924_9PLEO|nr:uncharacterized protein CC84DRAFT_1167043 [Paraphaeosphaeria sporulosa]OAG03339.1 hypothetical protein CC84DRAFT_1167043 [Paraphaeosphaeria sporulosa]